MEDDTQPAKIEPAPMDRDLVVGQPVIWNSAEILKGASEAWIEHEGEMYRLRLTSNGKLYLTK